MQHPGMQGQTCSLFKALSGLPWGTLSGVTSGSLLKGLTGPVIVLSYLQCELVVGTRREAVQVNAEPWNSDAPCSYSLKEHIDVHRLSSTYPICIGCPLIQWCCRSPAKALGYLQHARFSSAIYN